MHQLCDVYFIKDKNKQFLTNPNPLVTQLYSVIKVVFDSYKYNSIVHHYWTKIFYQKFSRISWKCQKKLPANSKIIALGEINLFSSILTNETVKLILNLLLINQVNQIISADIITLLKLSLNPNYFTFNIHRLFSITLSEKKYYKELKIIKPIATKNGNTIDKTRINKNNKLALSCIPQRMNFPYFLLYYFRRAV